MKILRRLDDLRPARRPVLLAAGFFDGIHRGHRRVIGRALADARRGAGEAWVLTFDPHPRKVLMPAAAPALLTTVAHKLRLLKRLGIAGCVVAPFTRATARQEPEAFIAALKQAAPALARLYVGRNWVFGRGGRGNAALLKKLAPVHGFRVVAVPPAGWRSQPVSSTRIRRAVAAGRLADAARMLGRPFSVLGVVRRGRKIGRNLGFPTANLDYGNEAHPPPGVYAVTASVGGQRRAGIANLGRRPTFQRHRPKRPVLELHLFDFKRDLYGETLEVFFRKRLRAERKFASPAALRAQIVRDIARARRLAKTSGKFFR
jgi:riboflavin kinase/FMN adenylyltransferase